MLSFSAFPAADPEPGTAEPAESPPGPPLSGRASEALSGHVGHERNQEVNPLGKATESSR